jgi:hypothetical protein
MACSKNSLAACLNAILVAVLTDDPAALAAVLAALTARRVDCVMSTMPTTVMISSIAISAISVPHVSASALHANPQVWRSVGLELHE